MFNDMFGDLFERVRPALNEGMTTVQAYAERIIARLDDIVDAVQQDETLNVRRIFTPVLNATNGQSQEIVQVPTDQDWILETITGDSDGITLVRITSGNGGPMLAGLNFGAAGVSSAGGNNVIFPGGSVVVATQSGAGQAKLYLQFRYERRQSRSKATSAGLRQNVPADSSDARTEAVEDGRHANAGVYAGNNVIGDRHIAHPV